jgi:hypothetical protein
VMSISGILADLYLSFVLFSALQQCMVSFVLLAQHLCTFIHAGYTQHDSFIPFLIVIPESTSSMIAGVRE